MINIKDTTNTIKIKNKYIIKVFNPLCLNYFHFSWIALFASFIFALNHPRFLIYFIIYKKEIKIIYFFFKLINFYINNYKTKTNIFFVKSLNIIEKELIFIRILYTFKFSINFCKMFSFLLSWKFIFDNESIGYTKTKKRKILKNI